MSAAAEPECLRVGEKLFVLYEPDGLYYEATVVDAYRSKRMVSTSASHDCGSLAHVAASMPKRAQDEADLRGVEATLTRRHVVQLPSEQLDTPLVTQP